MADEKRIRWTRGKLLGVGLFEVLILSASVVLGVGLFYLIEARSQHSAVARIQKLGGEVTYELGMAPAWLQGWVPRDLTDRVVAASLTNPELREIDFLKNLPHLRELELVGTGVYDISVLSRLWVLEGLIVDASPVRDLSPLANLTNLKNLRFNETRVRDLEPLAGLELEELWFAGTPIRRLEPIAHMESLQSLVLDRTQVEDLYPLVELTDMRMIRIDHSNVQDLRPLERMKKLTEVSLKGLPLLPSQVARLDIFLPNWQCKALFEAAAAQQ